MEGTKSRSTDRIDPAEVDLINCISKIQTRVTQTGSDVGSKRSGRSGVYRDVARFFVERVKFLDRDGWRILERCFEKYVRDTARKVVVLRHNEELKYLFLRYRHRFLRKELFMRLKRFELVFKNADRFRFGVFITLTMDPGSYSNLLEASRRISEAFNRFMSFLAKRVGFRPSYVSVLEPQNSGNPHLHVIIFGVRRLGDHFELTEFLKRHGFGEIHYEYVVVNRGGSWVWANKRPRGSDMTVQSYLKKYLKKVFWRDVNKLSYYFATGKRFFTHSRDLALPRNNIRSFEWYFYGVFYFDDLPDPLRDWINAYGYEFIPDGEEGWILRKPPG